MKIKTAELTCEALDYAVAVANAIGTDWEGNSAWLVGNSKHKYSSNWSQGGPIIEREEITVACINGEWYATKSGKYDFGPDSPLQAAMRCYVASKIGDVVDVPEELVG